MIYLILLLGLILRLVNLNQSFWLDEAAQVIESSRPLIEQFDLSSDFHPPLFHLLLHFWLYLGKSEVGIRLFSVGLGLLSVFILYKLVRFNLSEKIALVSALLLTINPYHIWYSQEARPYILFLVTTLLATYFLNKKNFSAYALSLAAAFYSVYTAVLLVPAHLLIIYLRDRKSLTEWLTSLGGAGLLFFPWLPHFFRQLQVGFGNSLSGWTNVVSVPAIKLIPLTLAKFIFGRGSITNNFHYGLVVLPVFLIFAYGSYQAGTDKKHRGWLVLFGLPLVLSQILAFIWPVMAPQRLIMLLPYFLVLIGIGLDKLKPKLFYLALAIALLTNTAGLVQYYLNPYVQREQWRQAVRYVESQSRGKSLVIFDFSDAFAPWLWYSRGSVDYLAVAPDFKVSAQSLMSQSDRLQKSDQIFYFYYLTDLTDPRHNTIQFIESLGFVETHKRDFPGVGFVATYEKILAFD